MAEQDQNKMKKKEPKPRQEWNAPWYMKTIRGIWMVLFGAFKVAVGAAATVAIIGMVCFMVLANATGDYLQEDIIPGAGVDLATKVPDRASRLYYVDANDNIQLLRVMYASASQEDASFDELPQDLIHAAVAIEDKRFFEHQGVDWVTTIKACARMFMNDAGVGGSTITQQMIKNYTGKNEILVQRKVQEIISGILVEKKYSKEEILEKYMNIIFMGEGCVGVKSAAATYFGKELQELTLAECASLIGITNNPSLYDPYISDKTLANNRERQLTILDQMLEQGWINQDRYDEAVAQEMVFKSGIADADRWVKCQTEGCGYQGPVRDLVHEEGSDHYYCPDCGNEIEVKSGGAEGVYSYFEETVIQDVAEALAKQDGIQDVTNEIRVEYINKLTTAGYHIYTTLNKDVQDQVDAIYNNLDEIPETYGGQQLLAATVIIDNRTGDICALAGGVGEKDTYFGYNLATDAYRGNGSSIKPLTAYAPAFEAGMTPVTPIWDIPLTYDSGAYPLNNDRSYSYRSTILNALTNSINAVAAWMVYENGIDYSFDIAVNKLCFKKYVEEEYSEYYDEYVTDRSIGALALGDQIYGATVREETAAYAAFANNGIYRQARTFTKVYDRNGNLVLDNTQESHEAFSEKTVNYMNYCLRNAVVNYTTEANLSTGIAYGKSGTTGNSHDRWYCGFTKYYTSSVWVGFEQPETIRTVSWDNPAATMWRKVMEPINDGKEEAYLHDTSGMSYFTICKDSGKLATDACRKDIRITSAGYSPTQSAMAYWEDVDLGYCDQHVLVDYCKTGNGVATDYCKKFAEVDKTVEIEEVALVKLTKSQLDEIIRAGTVGLEKAFLRDDYIYYINDDGSDAEFHGINGNVNTNVKAPYQVCTVHTKEAWEAYEKAHPSKPGNPTTPTVPVPSNPTIVTPAY